ncbi:hypothetical protein QTP88_002239 [Uroleucon formosanum]
MKNIHALERRDNIMIAPQHGYIEIAPQIRVPNIPAGSSNELSESSVWGNDIDEMDMVRIVNNYEKAEEKSRKSKRMRMNATTSEFKEVASVFNGLCKNFFKKNIENIMDYRVFLEQSRSSIRDLLFNSVQQGPIKYSIKVESTYEIPNTDVRENRAFKTKCGMLFLDTNINNNLDEDFIKIIQEENDMMLKGSGFSLVSIDGILININKYSPLGGSSYIPLPACLENKKATINVQNIDNKCFKYSILAKLVNPVNSFRVGSNYTEVENSYDFSNLNFPTTLSDVGKFEKKNPGVSVNIYSIKQGKLTYKNNIDIKNVSRKNRFNTKSQQTLIFPVKVCDEELEDHHDLLLFGDGTGKQHYCRITNLSRLVGVQLSRHGHAKSICKRCFKTYSGVNAHQRLNDHKLKCKTNTPLLPILPLPDTFMKFENWERTQKHPFSIYADLESILEKNNDLNEMKNTNIIHHHDLMSYCYYVKPSENIPLELLEKFSISTEPVLFRGDSSLNKGEVAKKFMEDIVEVGRNIDQLLNTNIPFVMTNEDNKKHREVADQGTCPFCKSFDTRSINVIPNTEEKLISFTKYISNAFQIRFVDSFRFMATSLEKLVNNLEKGGKSKFRETKKIFSENDIDLVTRKGFYPYEYTDSWEKLNETTLPAKEKFYNTLNETHISNDDYEQAKTVWSRFNCNTLGEYSDWYLKIDVMLLVDCFENFRDLCLKTYGLDPNYYFTAPGMSFDCMLKYTEVNLELLSDYDQILMFEQGIRGGLTHAVKRYAKANNIKVPEYDASKPESWIVYLDATNLYGWAMSRAMPKDGFGWYNDDLSVENILNLLDEMNETSEVGWSLEVDVEYPQSLHDDHNDLPYLAERITPPGSKIKKLVANLQYKNNYIVHYMALKQALKAGLILKKVHRVLKFNQSPWLAKYIKLNTNMRKNAENDFEKDFYKLMNNAVFGKTMENVRNRMDMKLVSDEKKCAKLINRITFKNITIYNNELAAVQLDKDVLKFDKPIYIGFSILDVSKTLMYDFHYSSMKKHYGHNIELMYMDTDSFIYSINTHDFYADLKKNSFLFERMDTSNLPIDHPCYCVERKKLPGTFTDETDGHAIREFIALRAKSYAYNLAGIEKIKSKGIRNHVVKNHLTMSDHKKCLFWDGSPPETYEARHLAVEQSKQFELTRITSSTNQYTPFRVNKSLRSFKHEIKTNSSVKLALNRCDDKRIVCGDQIHTIAHGHYSLKEDEPEDDWPELDEEGHNWKEEEKGLMRDLLQFIT